MGALYTNTTGGDNTAIGYYLPAPTLRASANVCIGVPSLGQAGVNSTTWIQNVYRFCGQRPAGLR